MGEPVLPMPETVNQSAENVSANVVNAGGRSVHVQQGPVELVNLAFNPPPWLHTAISLVVLVVAILVFVGLIRHGIDDDVLEEMAQIVFIVIGVLVMTNLSGTFLPLPYIGDVLVGGFGGYLLAQILTHAVYKGVQSVTPQP